MSLHCIPKRHMSSEFKKFFGLSEALNKLKLKNDKMVSNRNSNLSFFSMIVASVLLGASFWVGLSKKRTEIVQSTFKRHYYRLKLAMCTNIDTQWLLTRKLEVFPNLIETMNKFKYKEAKNESQYIRLTSKLILTIKKQLNRQYLIDVRQNMPNIVRSTEMVVNYKLMKNKQKQIKLSDHSFISKLAELMYYTVQCHPL